MAMDGSNSGSSAGIDSISGAQPVPADHPNSRATIGR
jgi:hypothetical protein